MRRVYFSLLGLLAIGGMFFLPSSHEEPLFGAAAGMIDNFESYSVGDLNGGSGGSGWTANWIANTTYDIQSSVTLNAGSTRAIGIVTDTGGEHSGARTFTGVDSGDLYVAMRASGLAAGTYCGLEAWNGTSTYGGSLVAFRQDPNQLALAGTGGVVTLLNPFVANTWYIVHINFVSATQWRVRWKAAGGTFSSFTANQTYVGSVSSPTRINIACDRRNGVSFYWDSWGTSDPDAPATTPQGIGDVIFFE